MSSVARLAALAQAVPAPDVEAERGAHEELDRKAKPRGSLGRLEDLAVRIAGMRAQPLPRQPSAAIVVACADHGVATRDVSAYPQEVTRQMVAAIAGGGAAISVLARHAEARLVLVDAGVLDPPNVPGLERLGLRAGGRDISVEDAFADAEEAAGAVLAGAQVGARVADQGAELVALGELGIANTTVAAALAAALTGAPPASVCGRGTGLDEAGLARKVEVVARALGRRPIERDDALDALRAVGGGELAVLAGVALEAARRRLPVLLDGFISGAAGLLAARLAPSVRGYLVAAHRSPEPGHAVVLEVLGLEPLLDLRLRLGEGTGAALALPLVSAALALLGEMATFAGAEVTDTGA